MSSFRDFKSQLTSARSLFESSRYGESLDVFADLLQRPRIRTQAARIFLDLFTERANLLLPSVAAKPIIEVVRLSLDALTASKDKAKARRTSELVRDILHDTYKIEIPESKSLRVALRSLPLLTIELPGEGLMEQIPVEDGGTPSEVEAEAEAEEECEYAGSSDGAEGSGGDAGGGEPAPRVPSEGGGAGGFRVPHGGGRGRLPLDGGEPANGKSTGTDGREVQVRRTPHMDVDASLPFQPGATFGVHVYADTKPPHEGEKTKDVVLTGGLTEYKVKVFLTTSSGLTVVGPESKPLTIQIKEERSTSADFRVHVDVAGPLEKATITATFFYEGLPCGQVTRVLPAGEAEGRMTIQRHAEKADLIVSIVAKDVGDDRRFECFVSTRHISGYEEAVKDGKGWHLPKSAPDIVNGHIALIKDHGTDPKSRLAALRSAGLELFESSPALFRRVFWRLVDEHKPLRTILIVSQETAYPWELMIPNGDQHPDQDYPLGVQYAVGRWITSGHDSPRQSIALKDAYVIAPKYIGDQELKSAPDEIKSLNACFQAAGCGPAKVIEPPDVPTIDASLETQAVTLLHFICHGKTGSKDDPDTTDPSDQVLLLDDNKPLSAKIIRGLRGFAKAFGQMHPLVFLNACEVGKQVPALSGTGGFAQSFIRIGASGIIAALWPVDDSLACEISTKFYKTLQEKKKIRSAEFLQELRKRAYDEEGEDTYAAYCFYGDPCGEVVIGV